MATTVSETVENLLDSGQIIRPNDASDLVKCTEDNFSKMWDALLDINRIANIELNSHSDDKLASTSLYAACDGISETAWNALAQILNLVPVLEHALGINISISSDLYYDLQELIAEKSGIRSEVQT